MVETSKFDLPFPAKKIVMQCDTGALQAHPIRRTTDQTKMEVVCHAELATDPLPYEVSPDATAAQVLRDVCALFGREEDEDTALEVDGVVGCVSGGGEDVAVGSLGLHADHADSRVVVKRSRERVLALVEGVTARHERAGYGKLVPKTIGSCLSGCGMT